MSRDARCLPRAAIYDPEFVHRPRESFLDPPRSMRSPTRFKRWLARRQSDFPGHGRGGNTRAKPSRAAGARRCRRWRRLERLALQRLSRGHRLRRCRSGLAHLASRALSLDYSLDQSEVLCTLLPYAAAATRAHARRPASRGGGDGGRRRACRTLRSDAHLRSVGWAPSIRPHPPALEKAADVIATRDREPNRATRRGPGPPMGRLRGQRP